MSKLVYLSKPAVERIERILGNAREDVGEVLAKEFNLENHRTEGSLSLKVFVKRNETPLPEGVTRFQSSSSRWLNLPI